MSALTSDTQPIPPQYEFTMRTLLEAIPDILMRVHRDGTFLNISAAEAFAQELGINAPALTVSAMLPPPIADQLLQAIQQALTSGTVQICTYSLPVGETRHAYETRVAVTGTDEVVLIVRDITTQHYAEELLDHERSMLTQRVEERTAELSAVNAALARAARLKDEFLASMSHELRTPLNAVLGLSEALQEEVYGPISEPQGRALRSIEESGRHLLSLINDILELSKIEAGKLELQIDQVMLTTICQASLRFIEQTAHKKHLRIVTSFDELATTVQADQRRFKQMLINLLSNAVKFTPDGGSIGLEVSADPDTGVVRCTVWDTGIGIAQTDMPRLFQPFVQLDSSLSRQYAGTGLGLALVHRMAQLHGGGVEVASEVGVGSRFTIVLPWSSTQPVLKEASSPSNSHPRALPRRVLLIDASQPTADQITRYLGEQGATVDIHPRSAGAVAKAQATHPDAIILDIQLPDGSGWDVLADLKRDSATRAIPVLINSVVDDPERAQQLGAAAYLIKPISRQQLQGALLLLTSPTDERRVVALPTSDNTKSDLTIDQPAPSPAPALAQPTLLLAEDNELNIMTFTHYLQANGYAVVVARSGQEALDQTQSIQPLLVLMDIHLPGIDGLEAIRQLRSNPKTAHIPIVALTALAMPGDRERCLAVGADDYLSKPVSLRSLVRAIERLRHQIGARETTP